jgi:hypothetical protein
MGWRNRAAIRRGKIASIFGRYTMDRYGGISAKAQNLRRRVRAG